MSLGGYKFAGRYCQKGSLTDAQWALKMHKTKVAAFMAANTLSGAGWDYDMTGSPDGNYHCLDSVGNNYVTVFKRTNGENDHTWFALYTLTYFTGTGTASGSVKVSLVQNYSGMYAGIYACNFYKIGTSQIAYSDNISTSSGSTPKRTGLLPMGNIGAGGSSPGTSYFPSTDTSMKDKSHVRFGFAIKNDSIIMFLGSGSSFSGSYTSCSIASGHAFSSFVNSDDSVGIFAYNTQVEDTTNACYESAARYRIVTSMSSMLCVSMNGYSNSAVHAAKLGAIPLAYYDTSVEEYPFQSLAVFGVNNSSTHVYGKGMLSTDLIALNFPGNNQGIVPNIYATFANGKYLCVNALFGTNYFYAYSVNNPTATTQNMAMYVGWDPSNPDITQASSWTEYTE